MRRISFIAAAVAFALGLPSIAVAQTHTIRVAHESPANHAKGAWAESFKRSVEQKSGGRVKVEIFHQGQLYNSERAAIEAAIGGLIQMAIPSTGYLSSIVPQFEVVDLPIAFADQDALYRFQDGALGQELLKLLETKNLVGLSYISNIPLDLFAKSRIADLKDFTGKKIRAHSAVLEQTVKALGGNPVSMPAAELYIALEQGIVDGAFTTTAFAAPNKYHEVTPFLTRAAVSAIAYPVVVNRAFWAALSAETKSAVQQAVSEATTMNREDLVKQSIAHLETLKKGGITVVELTPSQRAEWQDKLQVVYKAVEGRVGPALVARLKAN